MKAISRWGRLRAVLVVAVAAGTIFSCGSASAADPSKNVVSPARASVKKTPLKKKKYLVMTIASAIPVPIEYWEPIPTTASPVIRIGRGRTPMSVP